MNKPAAFGILLALLACAGVTFTVIQMSRMTDALRALESRVAAIDGGAAAPAAAPAGGDASAPASLSDLSVQIAALKSEVAKVKSSTEALESAEAARGEKSKKSDGGVPKKALKEAIDEALAERDAKRDKERKERNLGGDLVTLATNQATAMLAKELGLTEQQKAQIAEILKTQIGTIMGAAMTAGDDPATREQLETMKKETDEKIKAVLTPEQAVKYDEMQAKGGAWGGRRRGGDPGEK